MKVGDENIANGWIGTGLHFLNDETSIHGKKFAQTVAYILIDYVAQLKEKTFFSVGV